METTEERGRLEESEREEKTRAALAVARSYLQKEFPIERVAECCHLTIAQVRALAGEMIYE